MISAYYGPRAGAVEQADCFSVGGERIVFVDLYSVPDELGDVEPANDNGEARE